MTQNALAALSVEALPCAGADNGLDDDAGRLTYAGAGGVGGVADPGWLVGADEGADEGADGRSCGDGSG